MRRKIVVLITATILVVGMAVETALAADRAAQRFHVNYSTTGTQLLKSITGSSGTETGGCLSPGTASNAAKLQIWNANGSQLIDEQIYVPYPQNPNSVEYTFTSILDTTVKFKVRPVFSGEYIWGSGDIWKQTDNPSDS